MTRNKDSNDLIFQKFRARIRDAHNKVVMTSSKDHNAERRDRFVAKFANTENDTENLRIAVTGQSNAGKSTLIRALTGAERFIDADVSTTECESVSYGIGVELIDMPGTLSGKEEHTKKARDAVISSDLVMFVVSNEAFNQPNIKFFHEVVNDFGKREQLLLVVNQCDRMNIRDRTFGDAAEIVTAALRKNLEPFEIEDPSPVFVSSRDYLDSQKQIDSKLAKVLENDSRMQSLHSAIDLFCSRNGAKAKLLAPIQRDVASIIEYRKDLLTDDETASTLNEFLGAKLQVFESACSEWRAAGDELKRKTREFAMSVADRCLKAIEGKCDASEVNNEWANANERVEEYQRRLQDELLRDSEKSIKSLNLKLIELKERPISVAVEKICHLDDLKLREHSCPNEGKPISSKTRTAVRTGLEKAGEQIVKNSEKIGQSAVDIAIKMGTKFKPYGKIKLGNNVTKILGPVGKALGPLAVGAEIYMNYRDEQDKEKADEARRGFKADVRKTVSTYTQALVDSISSVVGDFESEVFEPRLSEIREGIRDLQSKSDAEERLVKELNSCEEELRGVAREIEVM